MTKSNLEKKISYDVISVMSSLSVAYIAEGAGRGYILMKVIYTFTWKKNCGGGLSFTLQYAAA